MSKDDSQTGAQRDATTPHPERAEAHAPNGAELWEIAWHWLWNAISVYGAPDEIANQGLTQRAALRLRAWLWSVEAIVRRLLVAAALRLNFVPPPRGALRPRAGDALPAAPLTSRKDHPEFRVFRFRSGLATATATVAISSPGAASSDFGLHRYFGEDVLMRLGPAAPRRARRAARLNQRRLTRAEARMYGLEDPEEEQRRSDQFWFGDPAARRRPHQGAAGPARGTGRRIAAAENLAPWLAELDNTQRIAMPRLGFHLSALRRVMENPMPAVRRLACALQRRENLRPAIAALPLPCPRRPRVLDPPSPPSLDSVAYSLAVLEAAFRDTS